MNKAERREWAVTKHAEEADQVDASVGAPPGRWNQEAPEIAMHCKGQPPKYEIIYPANTRVIQEDQSGRAPPQHLHARITAFVNGKGPYTNPHVPFDVKQVGHWENDLDEDLPHYQLSYLKGANGESGGYISCAEVHSEWRLSSPRLLSDGEPLLEEVVQGTADFCELGEAFASAWRHPSPKGKPRIVRILRE